MWSRAGQGPSSCGAPQGALPRGTGHLVRAAGGPLTSLGLPRAGAMPHDPQHGRGALEDIAAPNLAPQGQPETFGCSCLSGCGGSQRCRRMSPPPGRLPGLPTRAKRNSVGRGWACPYWGSSPAPSGTAGGGISAPLYSWGLDAGPRVSPGAGVRGTTAPASPEGSSCSLVSQQPSLLRLSAHQPDAAHAIPYPQPHVSAALGPIQSPQRWQQTPTSPHIL